MSGLWAFHLGWWKGATWQTWGWRTLCGLLLAAFSLGVGAQAAASMVTLWQAERAPGLREPDQPGPGADWQTVQLGETWRRLRPALHGQHTYRLRFLLPTDPEPVGVLVYSLGDRARVYVNGRLRADLGAPGSPTGAGQDHAGWPLLLTLDASDLQAGENQLWVQLEGTGWRLSGLSQVAVGPPGEMVALQRRGMALRMAMAGVVFSVCAVVTLLAGGYAVWWRQRGVALMLALAAALWGLRSALWWWPDSGLSSAVRLLLLDLGNGSAMVLACAVALRLGGVPTRRWGWVLVATAALQGLAALAVAAGAALVWRAAALYGLTGICGVVLLHLTLRALQPGQTPARVLALGGLAMYVLSGIDHWNLFFSTAPDAASRLYLTPLGLPSFLLACGWLLVRRVRRALRAEALAQRLRERRERTRQVAAESERQRLLRQLHDGLGSQLVGLLSAVQQRSVGTDQIEGLLRETLDELRLSLDMLDDDGRDLGELLGQLRFRLAPRLERAGLQLQWQVPVEGDLPPPPGLARAGGAEHLRHWLQEVLTNVLKHARARTVHLSAGPGWLHVHDDGVGFGPQPGSAGRGLRHLAERAQALGAEQTVHSGEFGTAYTLRWPLHRVEVTPAPQPCGPVA